MGAVPLWEGELGFTNGRPKTEMLRRNGPIIKFMESVLRLEVYDL